MNNIQKARDYMQNISRVMYDKSVDPQIYYVCKAIANAMSDGHTGCVVHTIPKGFLTPLKNFGFVIHNEIEEGIPYYIISWGEEIIA